MTAADTTVEPERRAVRSFVLRQGRLTDSQARALDELWPRYGLVVAEAGEPPLDLDALFGRQAPRVLEIGFGNGEALLAAATADPGRDHIGIEVHGPGVGRLLHIAGAAGIDNLRVFRHDAVEVLQRAIADASIDEFRVYFPDPWHKKRHHKRRLIQPPFVKLLRSKLRTGGIVHLATDWPDYAEQMLAVMDAEPAFRNRAGVGAYSPRPDSRLLTRFEQRGIDRGHPVADLIHEAIAT